MGPLGMCFAKCYLLAARDKRLKKDSSRSLSHTQSITKSTFIFSLVLNHNIQTTFKQLNNMKLTFSKCLTQPFAGMVKTVSGEKLPFGIPSEGTGGWEFLLHFGFRQGQFVTVRIPWKVQFCIPHGSESSEVGHDGPWWKTVRSQQWGEKVGRWELCIFTLLCLMKIPCNCKAV